MQGYGKFYRDRNTLKVASQKFTQVLGGIHDTIHWKKHSIAQNIVDTITLQNVVFVSQYEDMFPNTNCCSKKAWCCKCACDEILSNSHTETDRIMQVQDHFNTDTNCAIISATGNIETITNIIDTSLFSHKLPIVIGVHHHQKEKNKDGTIKRWYNNCSANIPDITNHYVVIVGKGYDDVQKMYYYRFYDVRTNNYDNGTSINNKLYINTISNMIEGNTEAFYYQGKGYYYILTEVRKNIGQKY